MPFAALAQRNRKDTEPGFRCPSAELFASAHGDDYLLGSCFLQSGNAVPTLIKTLRLLSR